MQTGIANKPKTPATTGIARATRKQKRDDAESRNKKYRALSLDEKIARQNPGGKVHTKLMEQKEASVSAVSNETEKSEVTQKGSSNKNALKR